MFFKMDDFSFYTSSGGGDTTLLDHVMYHMFVVSRDVSHVCSVTLCITCLYCRSGETRRV